ncbi:MAG TPA: hypothetical protein VFU49_00710 [Ktedonobacteraceae bacterium]|nr:hypothetical protein [Ktedonobacteraceae bacterium]
MPGALDGLLLLPHVAAHPHVATWFTASALAPGGVWGGKPEVINAVATGPPRHRDS